MGEKLVERGSRGMPHLQKRRDGNKLASIPKTDSRFQTKEVDPRGTQRQQPPNEEVEPAYQLTTDLLKMSSHSSVTISLTSPASTAERSSEAL